MEQFVLSPISVGSLIDQIAHRTAEILENRKPAPEASQPPEDLATRAEALKYLRITGATLWRWEKQGKIKSYGMGGKRYYRLSELEQSITRK